MKKRITLLLLSALLLTATSCGTLNVKPSPENTSEETSDTSEVTSDLYEASTVESETEAPVPKGLSTDEVVETLGLSELYAAVLKGELQSYDVNINSSMYLENYLTFLDSPFNRILHVTTLDCDQDRNTDAVIVESTYERVILHEYEGMVYSWHTGFRGLYYLKTDGTYSWTHGADKAYGTNKVSFDGRDFVFTEIDRVERDGSPDAKFFINGQLVTEADFLSFADKQPDVEDVTWIDWQYSEAEITLPPNQGK